VRHASEADQGAGGPSPWRDGIEREVALGAEEAGASERSRPRSRVFRVMRLSGDVPAPPAAGRERDRQPRLLDRVRDAIRVRHYSLRTEQAYVFWIRRYILFHGKRHPELLGADEIGEFLSTSR